MVAAFEKSGVTGEQQFVIRQTPALGGETLERVRG